MEADTDTDLDDEGLATCDICGSAEDHNTCDDDLVAPDPNFCAYCGAGPSRFMLGCCDECSERMLREDEAEVDG